MSGKEIEKARITYNKLTKLGLNKEDAISSSFNDFTEEPLGIYVFMGMFNYGKFNYIDSFAPDHESSDYALMINIESFEEMKINTNDLVDFLNSNAVIYPNIKEYKKEEFERAFYEVRNEYLELLLNENIGVALKVLDKKYAGRRMFK